MTQYFHFTLGPVQSFVGHARRTRDFWAGSFMLSWLTGIAMQAVLSQDESNQIIFPKPDENFLNAINGQGTTKPQQGSIPNRFKAKVSSDFKPEFVIEAVIKAWQTLADTIYQCEIAPHALTGTHDIWQRQVSNFWEMSWVLSETENDISGLDQRKNWRSHCYPSEAGVKCSLMGHWQELSGIAGVRANDNKQRDAFWRTLAQDKAQDIREKEYLCAMSYIKRRFVDAFKMFKVTLTGFEAHGWELPSNVPSVAYLAAAPWLANVLRAANTDADLKDKLEKFTKKAQSLNTAHKLPHLPEKDSAISCIRQLCDDKTIYGIDGNCFFSDALDNPQIYPNDETTQAADKREKPNAVKQALEPLTKQFGKPSPFYAILMMDGDSLGTQMSDGGKRDAITASLNTFTQQVPNIVSQHSGFLVYAGGDDVLALLPLDTALACAADLRQSYEKAFAQGKQQYKISTSISAAIIYTHITTPLANTLHEIHGLLDDIAKEATGRDAIAVRVYKGSGLALEWAQPWAVALDLDGKVIVSELANQFAKQDLTDEGFSSKFLYKIRQRFGLLADGMGNLTIDNAQALDLMAMEYMQSINNRKATIDNAKQTIAPLMKQCQAHRTQAGSIKTQNQIREDAALLVRFLAQKGLNVSSGDKA